MTMKPPPPTPQLKGSVTPSVAAAATAASTALPPLFRIASAACEAGSLIVATAPPVPLATGLLAQAGAPHASAMMMVEVSRRGRAVGVMGSYVGWEIFTRKLTR